MLKNYLINGFRNLKRDPGTSLMNVIGLAIGLAVCLIVTLYVQQERSHDRFHADAERIYRVVQEEADGPGMAWSGPQMGILLEQDFPQVEQMVRLIDGGTGYGTDAYITWEDPDGSAHSFNEDGFLYADPGFFGFFTFPLKEGAPGEVLDRPGTVVVTESVAERYFGGEDPVGQVLMLDDEHSLEVTGVAFDPPENSHLAFGFVTSYQTFYSNMGMSAEVNSFWWPPTHTYIKLADGSPAGELSEQLPAFSKRHRDADDAGRVTLVLQPLPEIWLGPDYTGQVRPGGSYAYLILFSTVALFVLVLACVNFVNLSTARALRRAREVGLRKAIGAGRGQLMVQFLLESVLVSLAAMLIAVLLAELMLPYINLMAGASLEIPYATPDFWILGLSLIVVTGLAAGCYPAIYLSGFQAALVHRGESRGGWLRGSSIRKSLVVFQFAVTVVLLVGTTVIYRQMQFVNETRLGFDREQVLVMPGRGLVESQTSGNALVAPRYETLKSEWLSRSAVRQVTNVSNRPGMGSDAEYVWEAEGLTPEPNRQVPVHFVGEQFFEMMDLRMAAGRPLRAGDPADIGSGRIRTDQQMATPVHEGRAMVINETAAARLGWDTEEAVGKSMRLYIQETGIIYQDLRGTVVGVVEDYHTASLREPIGPVVYTSSRAPGDTWLSLRHVMVKLNAGDHRRAIGEVEQVWQDVMQDYPFEATFLDESLAAMYRSEARMARMINFFTVLAVAIACLGLFGLASFAAEQRTREIGIRKVLGATVSGILMMLSFDFVKLVLAGVLIGVPVAWYIMNNWLSDFAYRIEIGPGIFAMAGGAALLIALVTVSWQSVKAALANPVDSLRSE